MKISHAWLRTLLPDMPAPERTAALLTAGGLEVEHIVPHSRVRGNLEGVVVGQVLEVWQHPNADRLRVTRVDVGAAEPAHIVCGAPNVAVGQYVLAALPGATLYPTEGEPITIKKSKIRGEESAGMLCAADELGLGADHAGIMVLDTPAPTGTPAAHALGLEADAIYEIGLTANRGDAASHLGVARDLAALLGLQSQVAVDAALGVGGGMPAPHPGGEANTRAAIFTIQRLDGVEIKPSSPQIATRLEAVGLSPINNVVDVTNYLLHHLGQPMHAYDADKVRGKLNVRNGKAGETLILLDGQELKLADDDLIVADESGPVALAGVMGGKATSVTAETKAILLEAACFAPSAVRRTAARHGVRTDSSFRFERGTDPSLPARAQALAARLLAEEAGATPTGEMLVDRGAELYARRTGRIPLRYGQINALIGQALATEVIHSILTNLGFCIDPGENEDMALVHIPPHRIHDVEGVADLVEEVVRIYGIDNLHLPAQVSSRFFARPESWHPLDLEARLGARLTALGFTEIVTNSIVADAQPGGYDTETQPVMLLNPLSQELSAMRRAPHTGALAAIAHNANRRQQLCQVYELAKTYGTTGGAYVEKTWLTLTIWGRTMESWRAPSRPVRFADVYAAAQGLLQPIGIDAVADHAVLPGMAAGVTLTVNNKTIGMGGQVAAADVKAADIKGDVYTLALDWAAICKLARPRDFKAAEPPRHPDVRRDLSLLLDETVPYESIKRAAMGAERKLLQSVNLFDVYTGDRLPQGKKAYAVAFTLATPDATLTDAQIEQAMARIEAAIVQKNGGEVRR